MEKINTRKIKYTERLPGPSEISELVTDGDKDDILTDKQHEEIETILEHVCETAFRKHMYGGFEMHECRDYFFKRAIEIGEKYGLKITR